MNVLDVAMCRDVGTAINETVIPTFNLAVNVHQASYRLTGKNPRCPAGSAYVYTLMKSWTTKNMSTQGLILFWYAVVIHPTTFRPNFDPSPKLLETSRQLRLIM